MRHRGQPDRSGVIIGVMAGLALSGLVVLAVRTGFLQFLVYLFLLIFL